MLFFGCIAIIIIIMMKGKKERVLLEYFSSSSISIMSIWYLIDFFDGGTSTGTSSSTGGTTSAWEATGHTARHATGSTTSTLVQFGDDGIANTFQFLLTVFVFFLIGQLIGIQPFDGFVTFLHDGVAVRLGDLALQVVFVQSGLHVEAVRFQRVLSGNGFLLLFIFVAVFLSLVDHV